MIAEPITGPTEQQDVVPPKAAEPPRAIPSQYARSAFREPIAELVELMRLIPRSYMEILLLRDGWIGLLFVVGTFLRPQAGLCGIIALLTAYAFGRMIGMSRDLWKSGPYLSNSLLVGLGLGSYLALSWPCVFFVSAMGVLTLVTTIGLASIFRTHLRLPILTVPFVLCMSVAYLASLRYSSLTIETSRQLSWLSGILQFPTAVDGFLRALGMILFVPYPIVGVLFAAVMLWRSSILFLLAIAGFTVGVAVRSVMLGSYYQAVSHSSNYNFILIGMVLGGVFFVPSLKSYFVAMIAVVAATILLDFTEVWWAVHGLSPYAFPFNVVALSFLYALSLMGFSRMPLIIGATPEETLQADLALRWRFNSSWRTLRLPFFGSWHVWQGFDGPWTHQGDWKHAYDFVISDEHGNTFGGTGATLKDYFCYRRPVASPIRGRVVKIVTDLLDNEPGQLNSEQNWGNLVIIHDDRGFYVLIAHFAHASIKVVEGTWVEPGTVLGQCGNSGFSPQPHLHIQVQATAAIGAPTLPFSFSGFLEKGRFESNGLPTPGLCVEPTVTDPQIDTCMEFILGDELVYAVHRDGKHVADLSLHVRVAIDGTLYFETDRGARLYFGKKDGTFFFYRVEGSDPYLSLLLRALPRLPLTFHEGLAWTDSLPASLHLEGAVQALLQLCSSFIPEVERMNCRLRFENRDEVICASESRLLRVAEEARTSFDGGKGPARVRLGTWELERVKQFRAGRKSVRYMT